MVSWGYIHVIFLEQIASCLAFALSNKLATAHNFPKIPRALWGFVYSAHNIDPAE